MTKPSNKFVLSAAALAVSALLAACGGGEAGPPPDVVPPTLAITDDVSAATATAAVTFTFTFSEDVGSSFTAEDIAVTGGTAGTFTKVDATHYTLVVTPVENAAGSIDINVAAAKYSDLSSNANAAASTASQAYNTVVTPPPSGGTVLASFDESTPPAVTEFGGAGYAIEAGPAGGSGKALKIARNGGENYAGAWVAIPAIPNNAGTQTISARVYSPTAGIPFVAKAEYGDNAGTGDRQANETVVAGWQTLTWTFTNLAAPNVYNRFTILPNLGVVDTNKNYYVDDITLVGGNSGGGGGAACGTTEPTCAPTTTIPSDALVIYSDAASVAGLDLAPDWGQGSSITRSEATIASNKSQKYVFTDPNILYQGISWGSPQNVSGKTTLKLDVWSAGVASIKVSLISPGPLENAVTKTLTAGGWNSLSIDLSQYNIPDLSQVIQIKLEPSSVGTVYVDNIHFAGTAGGGGGGGGASGSTGTCTTPCIDFAGADVGYEGFEGLVSSAQAADPVDAANKVAKFVKGPSGAPWAGATIYTSSGNKSVQAFDLAASKVVTLRAYAPSAGMKMTLKLENAANPGINMLKTVTTTQANAWETLTFDFATPTQGAFNPAETYNKVSIFPVFDPTVQNPTAPATDTTFYFDELKYTAVGGGGGGGVGGGGSGAATFSAGFSSNGLTANGGAFGGFSGSNQDNFNCSGDPGFCGAGGDFSGGTGSYYFYYYQTPTPASQMYVGMYVLAPGVTEFNNAGDTAGVSVGSRPNLKFTFNQNPEWFNSATNNFMVVVDLGKRYVAGGNTCRLQLRNVTTPTAATATAYTIPWTAFDLVQNCGQSLTVAQALAASPVSQISFQGVGNTDRLPAGGKLSGANTSMAVGGVYPSTVVVSGAITFE